MSERSEKITATMRLVPVMLIVSVLRAAAVDQGADVSVAPETSHVTERPNGIIWRWSWDQGVRYDVQVPFDQYWIGPDQRPLSDTPLEKRFAFIGKIGALVGRPASKWVGPSVTAVSRGPSVSDVRGHRDASVGGVTWLSLRPSTVASLR